MASSPFDKRQQALKAKGEKPKVSVDEALAVLRNAASSPQAHAALKTLEGQLQGGPENKGTPSKDSKGGFPSSNDVRQKFGGPDSAKGGNSAPPFEKRQKRAKANATAQGA